MQEINDKAHISEFVRFMDCIHGIQVNCGGTKVLARNSEGGRMTSYLDSNTVVRHYEKNHVIRSTLE